MQIPTTTAIKTPLQSPSLSPISLDDTVSISIDESLIDTTVPSSLPIILPTKSTLVNTLYAPRRRRSSGGIFAIKNTTTNDNKVSTHKRQRRYSEVIINTINTKNDLKKSTVIDKQLLEILWQKEKDQKYYPLSQDTYPLLQGREKLVKWILYLCSMLRISIHTIDLSIKLFDTSITKLFKSIKDLQDLRIHILICLVLACKLLEQTRYLSCTKLLYKYSKVTKSTMYEIRLAQSLQFHIFQITPTEYIQLAYECHLLYNSDDTILDTDIYNNIDKNILECTEQFIYFYTLNISLREYSPSLIAVAIILCIRTALGIQPTYTPKLLELIHTKTNITPLCGIYADLYHKYILQYPKARSIDLNLANLLHR